MREKEKERERESEIERERERERERKREKPEERRAGLVGWFGLGFESTCEASASE